MADKKERSKIRVAVLYGGRSGEHEVSLQSAASVIKNLDPKYFEVVPIGVDKQGRWLLNDVKQLGIDQTAKTLPIQTASTKIISTPNELNSALAKANGSGVTAGVDVVFPVMHGVLCEDGTIQGLLELTDLPYVGAGVLASAVGMDKDIAKRLVAAAGFKVSPYICIKRGAWEQAKEYYTKMVTEELGYPVFVKPANTGSSVGIHKVKRPEDLAATVADAFLYDVKILIEKAVNAREIELAALENPDYGSEPLVSIPGEIVPTHEFYSYEAKYLDEKGAELLIPAPITATQGKQAQEMAKRIFEILECEGMARVDLFLEKESGELYFNEVNTIPGFTQISMYPKLWAASGLAYDKLLTCLIDLAIARHQRKQGLKRDWAIVSE